MLEPIVFFSDLYGKKSRINIWTEDHLIWLRYQVMQHWLTLEDIVALDTATSCTVLRKELLRMYQNLRSAGANRHPYTSIESIRWVMNRGIVPKGFSLVLDGHEADATWPTFHYLCSQESTRDIALLMATNGERGIVNSVDAGTMWTALHYSVKAGNATLARMLVEEGGADVNARNGGGYTPLLVVCVAGDTCPEKLTIVKLLLKHGADLETRQGVSQWTPLHFCCHLGNVAVAKILISGGANVNSLTRYNKTPIDLCKKALRNKLTITGLIERSLKKLQF